MGTITQDRSTSIYGELGRKADTVPLSTRSRTNTALRFVSHADGNDRAVSPFIAQMAIYSSIDATERTLGWPALVARLVEFQKRHTAAETRQTLNAGDFSVPLQVSNGVASPLAYLWVQALTRSDQNISVEIEAV